MDLLLQNKILTNILMSGRRVSIATYPKINTNVPKAHPVNIVTLKLEQ